MAMLAVLVMTENGAAVAAVALGQLVQGIRELAAQELMLI